MRRFRHAMEDRRASQQSAVEAAQRAQKPTAERFLRAAKQRDFAIKLMSKENPTESEIYKHLEQLYKEKKDLMEKALGPLAKQATWERYNRPDGSSTDPRKYKRRRGSVKSRSILGYED